MEAVRLIIRVPAFPSTGDSSPWRVTKSGGTSSHIAVITHPDFRGRGYGRSAVAHLAARALAAGLLPQYRTLVANHSSIHVAQSLGFELYATSMAVRL
jgi:predicted GNAT family acetyltransferase